MPSGGSFGNDGYRAPLDRLGDELMGVEFFAADGDKHAARRARS
jgi:hypothetical protein